MLESMIDRLTIAHALARSPARTDDDGMGVERSLPVFTSTGAWVGDPWTLRLDWSRLPERELSSPAVVEIVDRALDALSARYRAAALVDTEGVAAADVAGGLDEPLETVRRRLHRVRMALREHLTDHFTRSGSSLRE